MSGRGTPYDWSPGDVIYAYEDGTIVLDDGITTYNPTRAAEWLLVHGTPAISPNLERIRRWGLVKIISIGQKQRAAGWRR